MMMGHVQVMFFILIFRMAVQVSLTSLCAVPLSLPSSASCAGVTAAAGEVATDEKCLAAVEKVGSDFIPLVVEAVGDWTPFALKMLYVVADCSTPRSGVLRKLAWKNLLQQLSIQLWINNAKMILRYWA